MKVTCNKSKEKVLTYKQADYLLEKINKLKQQHTCKNSKSPYKAQKFIFCKFMFHKVFFVLLDKLTSKRMTEESSGEYAMPPKKS